MITKLKKYLTKESPLNIEYCPIFDSYIKKEVKRDLITYRFLEDTPKSFNAT